MNRFWWSCKDCKWELSERVSGSLGQPKKGNTDKRWCNCHPPKLHYPTHGKDTSQ